MSDHIFVISYNRPALLRNTLAALASQTAQDWRITLFQDGPLDPSDVDEKKTIKECVDTFRMFFPAGDIFESSHNLGVGLNLLSAQQQAFRGLGLDVAFFFEDDLITHRSYMEQMLELRNALMPYRHLAPYFACYGCTHAFSPRAEQIHGSGLRFMDHLWGYGLFREHWEEEQEILKPYFDYLRTTPYRVRSHEVIRDIFRRMDRPLLATSQDSARIVALLSLGRCSVTTLPQRAIYSGREGTHSTGPAYDRWCFRTDPLPDHIAVVSPEINLQTLASACADFPAWVQAMQTMPPNQIDLLEAEAAEREHETSKKLAEMEREISNIRCEIAESTAKLAEKELEIGTLARQAARLEEQLHTFQESTCWRATAPLRRALDKARTARRRLFRKATTPLSFRQDIVAIDISTIWNHDAGTGIQRVVRRLAKELAGEPRGQKPVVLIDYSTGVPRDVTRPFLAGEGNIPHAPAITEMDMLLMLDSSYNLAPSFSRRLREAKERGVFVVSICHDLLPVTNPEWFSPMNHIPFRRWLNLAVQYSNAFLCVSDTTASRLSQFIAAQLQSSKLQIDSWPLGNDMDNIQICRGDEAGGHILTVGTVEPRKNHLFILEALRRMRSAGHKPPRLVVVGRDGWKNRTAVHMLRQGQIEGWVTWHKHGVPDTQLAGLYAQATCVVQASLDEGFGLPVAEAAAFGKPVVLSDIPVFREIVREDGYFFQLGDTKSFAEALAAACLPEAKPTKTKAVTWQESADIFWKRCLALQAADRARRAAESTAAMN